MANCYALRPTRAETEKTAQAGTLMMRRSDVLGVVRKMLHYAYSNAKSADEDGRARDREIQQARMRTLIALREALKATPIFENPATTTSVPYSVSATMADDYRAASGMSAGTAETPKSGSGPKDRQPGPEGETPNPDNRTSRSPGK